MRALSVISGIVILSIKAVADPLSSADREALLENIQKLRDTVAERADARFVKAIEAYRTAMMDEGAALEFYLKCIEKVNFEDQGKKASEFNDWKKREKERTSEASMRRALMHQLRWLVLALKASSEKADYPQLTVEGQNAIDDLFRDKVTLTTQRQILGQSVIGTVFAKVYEIGDVKLEKWPATPLDIASFYEQLVFPAYRVSGDVDSLRAGWTKRIQQESALREVAPAAKPKTNGRGQDLLAEIAARGQERSGQGRYSQDRFVNDILPDLQWQMEMDLFRCGDQQGAATRMFAHLQKHLTHDKSKAWSEQLKALLMAQTPVVPVGTPGTPTAGNTVQPSP
jgi:hypothetical protein